MKKISVVLPLLAPTPFLWAMTQFSIEALRAHADNEFELIIAEATYDNFNPDKIQGKTMPLRTVGDSETYTIIKHPDEVGKESVADIYMRFEPKIGGVREVNQAIRMARGEFIVATGNDVIVPPHWDTELLKCFEERKDCGLAALSACEPGAVIGPPPDQPQDIIVEGMYSPFMMWRKGWEYDEAYERIYQDSDLVMRMYEAGLRSYRSCRAHVHHLLRMTNDNVDAEAHNIQLGKDERRFYNTWGKSPLAAFAMIRCGRYHYGQEFQSFLQPINLHYDPSKPE